MSARVARDRPAVAGALRLLAPSRSANVRRLVMMFGEQSLMFRVEKVMIARRRSLFIADGEFYRRQLHAYLTTNDLQIPSQARRA